jgi:hypothetical protein
MNKVENLKKVTLQLKANTSADRMDLTPSTSEFEFIFGIGPGGMCPFEYQLVNKAAGDEIGILLKRKELSSLFGHLHPPIMNFFEHQEALHLDIRILRIEQPENIEVIKALSEAASHHHGCDCGCGC